MDRPDPDREIALERMLRDAGMYAAAAQKLRTATPADAARAREEAGPVRRTQQYLLIQRLRQAWMRHPRMRLAQLIGNAWPPGDGDPYYTEDEQFIKRIEEAGGSSARLRAASL